MLSAVAGAPEQLAKLGAGWFAITGVGGCCTGLGDVATDCDTAAAAAAAADDAGLGSTGPSDTTGDDFVGASLSGRKHRSQSSRIQGLEGLRGSAQTRHSHHLQESSLLLASDGAVV